MTAKSRHGFTLLPLLAVLGGLFMCVGIFSLGRMVINPPAREPTPLPTRRAPTAPPAATRLPSVVASAPPSAAVSAAVVNVVDGDTIEVSLNGLTVSVRYIGIDTPERDEACYAEAMAFNAALVAGQTVTLVKDVSETDQFNRLLRYVFVGDQFVNAEIVAQGYARAVSFPPDTLHYHEFVALEDEARQAGLGCHAVSTFFEQGGAGGNPPQAASPASGQGDNCDPSYPTVCIPPPPPDLDCGEINFRRFQVLPPDPHHFDGDNDGVGCQS